MNRTILRKCAVTTTCVQTVDARPGCCFFDEWPGYEANFTGRSVCNWDQNGIKQSIFKSQKRIKMKFK